VARPEDALGDAAKQGTPDARAAVAPDYDEVDILVFGVVGDDVVWRAASHLLDDLDVVVAGHVSDDPGRLGRVGFEVAHLAEVALPDTVELLGAEALRDELATFEEGHLVLSVVGVPHMCPAAPVEFEQTIASASALQPLLDRTGGGAKALEDGLPRIREVREGRPASGRGWIGITPRGAFETASVTQTPLLPAWAVLLLISGLILGGWLREGRR